MGSTKAPAQVVKIAEAKEADQPRGNEGVAKQDSADRVTLSPELQVVMNRAQATPDVDQAKVDAIRSAIQQGSFQVDPKAIADKMVGNS